MPKQCGAKTRSGQPCKGKAMTNGRCRMHGGKSTGAPGNTNAVKAGSLYSQYLTPDEQADYQALQLGDVDHELRLTRIRLARALKNEQEKGDTPEIDTVIQRKGGGRSAVAGEVHRKRRDYAQLIDRLTARIESLEKTRAELLKQGAGADDDPPEPRTFTYSVIDGRKPADADAD